MLRNKFIALLIIGIMLVVISPAAAFAATTADVTITATPSYIAITNTPSSYDFGVIAASATPATNTTYFTANNTGNVVSNITLLVTAANWTGGVGWIHSNTATAGVDTVGLKCGTQDDGNVTATIIKTTAMTLHNNVASYNTTKWGITMYAPTSFGDGAQKTVTVRLTIVQA